MTAPTIYPSEHVSPELLDELCDGDRWATRPDGRPTRAAVIIHQGEM